MKKTSWNFYCLLSVLSVIGLPLSQPEALADDLLEGAKKHFSENSENELITHGIAASGKVVGGVGLYLIGRENQEIRKAKKLVEEELRTFEELERQARVTNSKLLDAQLAVAKDNAVDITSQGQVKDKLAQTATQSRQAQNAALARQQDTIREARAALRLQRKEYGHWWIVKPVTKWLPKALGILAIGDALAQVGSLFTANPSISPGLKMGEHVLKETSLKGIIDDGIRMPKNLPFINNNYDHEVLRSIDTAK